MSAQPTPAPAPAPDPKSGLAVRTAIFRRNAKAAGWEDEEIKEFTDTFQTVSDVDVADGLFKSTLPPELKEKENALVKGKLQLKKAGTPPEKLPGSSGETPAPRLNSKARENIANMFILKGAIVALHYNPETGDHEVI